MRDVLERVTTVSAHGLPDSKLEDPLLYYPLTGGLSHYHDGILARVEGASEKVTACRDRA